MPDPKAVLVMLGVVLTIWVGSETVKGVKWIGRHVKQGITHVVHPHQETKK